MAGRTPQEAVRNFLEPLRRAIACVSSTAVAVHQGGYELRRQYGLIVGQRGTLRAFKLRCTSGDYSLSVIMNYQIVEATGDRGPFKVSIVGYAYTILDTADHELLAYHWHPENPDIKFPHLHAGNKRLKKKHLPTGRIALEQVLSLAINDFKVRAMKDDWRDILGETQRRFETWRTWG